MPAFHYIAMNATGQDQKGVLEADSEKHARQLLRQQSLIPVNVRPAQQKKSLLKTSLFSSFGKPRSLSSKELALITRQFATLLSAGLPIEEAILAVAEQTEKQRIKGLLLSVRGKVLEGHALAAALREQGDAFSPLYISTIAAGEKSGHLDKVLVRLADYTEQQWHMQQKIKTAMIYPSMMVLVAFGIVCFLLEYVVPKMVAVYGHLDQSLPLLTQILISISNIAKIAGWYVLLLLVLGGYAAFYFIKKNPILREKVHHFILRLPLIGNAVKTADTARFARTLSILSASGVPVLDAMTISAQLILSLPIRKAVLKAVNRVREGGTIHFALKQTHYFSPMSVHMMASGEASGQLENMLERVAINQEGEILRMIEVVLALFEPAIILLMGAIVLFIVLAVMLPIFNLNEFTG